MNLKAKKLSTDDFTELFDFEKRNWDYFSQFIPERSESYKQYESFCAAQESLLQSQINGDDAYFIIYDNDKIIARTNLFNISDGQAEIGYRVCQSAMGKGVATSSTAILCEAAQNQFQLSTIIAIAGNNNPASSKVLVNNGFQRTHTQKDAFILNGKSIDFVHFRKLLT